MKRLTKGIIYFSLALLLINCREPFTPDFETGKNDYLVVEGFIHVGQKAITRITLSRVSPLLGPVQVFENNASVMIESMDNAKFTKYPLNQEGNGNYQSDSLNLDPTFEYRLLITTEAGKQYYSDFIQAKTSPAIDSLHWEWKDEGIQIYVSTHDEEKGTRYYAWDYEETWEIHSSYKSKYKYEGGAMVLRGDPGMFNLYECWQTASSEDLHFASTSQLEIDAIHYPLTLFGHYSERTGVRYSILVEQRALTKEEFEYLQLIQKNSTVTGSLFDPMPSEIRGNIHSLNHPNEPVIGFIGASTTQAKRFFVTAAEFGVVPPAKCDMVIVAGQESIDLLFGSGTLIPIGPIGDPTNLSYTGAPVYCMDCKLRGSPVMPDFWY